MEEDINIKPLKKINDKFFLQEIKRFIKNHHEIYEQRLPEIEILAKKIYEEYDLSEFYKVFNKLWKGSHKEQLVALYTLLLYEDRFNLEVWRLIKSKIREIKSVDQADLTSKIIGKLLLKYPALEKEILNLSKNEDMWIRRIGMIAIIPQIKNGKISLALEILENNLKFKDEMTKKILEVILREVYQKNPLLVKKFLSNHKEISFFKLEDNFSQKNNKKFKIFNFLRKIFLFINFK